MKKTLLLAVLVMLFNGAYAQSAALTIKNGSKCKAYINVWAADATTGNSNPCDIYTCTIIVPPLTTYSWGNPVGVLTSTPDPAGICGMATPFTAPMLAAALAAGTFIWTDLQAQYSCPSGCTEGGCYIGSAASPIGTCLPFSVPSWASTFCLGGANWNPAASTYMSDIVVTIY